MAVFNPDFPDQDPKYFGGLSHPISDIKPDTSTGEALKGVGEVFSSAVKVAHNLNQQDIHDHIIAGIDAERSKATTQLESKLAQYRTGSLTAEGSAPTAAPTQAGTTP